MRRFSLWLFVAMLVAVAIARDATAVSWDGGNATFVWGDNGNWNPDGSPAGQPVLIGDLAAALNDTTLLDATFTIDSLTITNGADVVNSTDNGATNDFIINVNGNTTVSNAGSSIVIFGGDSNGLDTDNLTINSGASLILNSTTPQGTSIVEVDGGTGTGQLNINAGGTLTGTGRIDLEAAPGAATSLIVNSGSIIANTAGNIIFGPPTGTLQITATSANARFDWDGGGAGILEADGNQTLDIDVAPGAGAAVDAFSGTMNLFTGSTINISSAWSLDSGTINANTAAFGLILPGQDPNPGPAAHIAGGAWTMSGGTINVDDGWDSLQLDSALTASGGTINNHGTMIFNAAATINAGVDFQMTGTAASITVAAGNVVTINDANFDLDGGNALTNVTTIGLGATLEINHNDVLADDTYSHTINLNGGTLNVSNAADALPWTLNSAANVNAAGGATSIITGDAVSISADINVTGNSTLQISADSEFFAATTVVVEAGSTVNVNNSPIYNGGSYTGAGLLRPGTATIATATTWGTGTVKLDDGTITANANLTVNTNAIDIAAGDGYDGSMTIADAALVSVNIAGAGEWTVDPTGDINYSGGAAENTFLTGSKINLNGTLSVTGDGRTNALLNIGSTGIVNAFTLNEPIRLSGGNLVTVNRIAGGTINGPGRLGFETSRALVGFGTINSDIEFFANGNRIRADDGILTLNGAFIGVGGSVGTEDADGIMNITDPWNTTSVVAVTLVGGELRGNTITNDNVARGIEGVGLVSARVINNTRIDAEATAAGTLVLQTAANTNDWDGSGAGQLNAVSRSLELVDNASFPFTGTVSAAAGLEVFANGFELEFEPTSTLSLTGGTYRATIATDIGGIVTIGAGTATLQGGTKVFEATSTTTLTGNLKLDNESQINAGATFSGGGTLINVAGRKLTLLDGADVDVFLQNDGSLVLGASAGQTQGLDFEQTATGEWNVELGGTGLNSYDRMTLTGLTAVDGTLNLSLIGGYVPTLADPLLTILSASSVSGTFDAVFQPAGMPAGLKFNVIYNAANIQLQVANALLVGDYNNNGTVDAGDYVLWRKGGPLQNDPTPGVQPADYDVWRAHFGQIAGSGAGTSSNATIPEPSTLVSLILAAVGWCFQRRRVA